MTDFFLDGETFEPEVNTTSNIEFQLNQFNDNEYINKKIIPEKALFVKSDIINSIKTYYKHNIDIPILVYGAQGIGKLTTIIGLLNNIPKSNNTININNNNAINNINNIHFFKILDDTYNKIFYYENYYYLNISILNNNNEILDYLKYIYKIAKEKNITIFDNDDNDDNDNNVENSKIKEKKIIIITHIYKCNQEAQLYLAFMLDKINTNASYIFTTYSKNTINKKILSSCASLNFKHLDETEFIKIFKINFKTEFAKDNHILTTPILKQFYEIYVENKYNLGNTISQIKYHLIIEGTKFLKDKSFTNGSSYYED
jgi:DNA polymerase III delta prime subunit